MQMATSNSDVRLKRLLEASVLMLKSTSAHQGALPPSQNLVGMTSSLVVRGWPAHRLTELQKESTRERVFMQERLQVGTNNTVAQVHDVFSFWRAPSFKRAPHRADSRNGELRATESLSNHKSEAKLRTTSDSLMAAKTRRSSRESAIFEEDLQMKSIPNTGVGVSSDGAARPPPSQ